MVQRKEPFQARQGDRRGLARPDGLHVLAQLVSADVSDTRMRLVLHVKLNMMMKMMIGGKLQQALDQIADQIAEAFNNAPV